MNGFVGTSFEMALLQLVLWSEAVTYFLHGKVLYIHKLINLILPFHYSHFVIFALYDYRYPRNEQNLHKMYSFQH